MRDETKDEKAESGLFRYSKHWGSYFLNPGEELNIWVNELVRVGAVPIPSVRVVCELLGAI